VLPCRRIAFAAILLLIFLFSASQAQSSSLAPPESLPTLTTALAVHSLSVAESLRAYPVHLQGVITYYDPDYGSGVPAIFLHDATGGIFIKMAGNPAETLFVGALVEVKGVSAPGGYGTVVGTTYIHVLGRAPLPATAPRVTLADINSGKEDAQWVEVEGCIHEVFEVGHMIILRLEMADGPIIVVLMKTPGATYSHLTDALVRIRANAAPSMNSDNQIIGFLLQAPDLSTLQVVTPAPAEPFALPLVPISKLLQREYFFTSMHRIRLRGNVTLQWPGSMVCIGDAGNGICAETSLAVPAAVGELVDVAGFVEIENHVPVLTNAVFRSAGNYHPVAPKPVTAEKILSGGYGSQVVQIDGQLIGYDLTSSDAILQLSSGDALLPAILPKSLAESKFRVWKVGSRLRITGICSVGVDIQRGVRAGVVEPKSFRILMRSPGDVIVLEQPSWWTPAHALFVLALVFTATLCVLAWVVFLRRRVELQAHQLRDSEQRFRHLAQHDTLTGLASRLLFIDRLNDAIEKARHSQNGLALLMVDMDQFKEINDTYGHQAGDEVLRMTAQRMLDAVRISDTVVRLGGDEFVILLPEIRDPRDAETVAATLVTSLARPIRFNGTEMPVSVSIGIGTAFTADIDAEELMQQADIALYRAKNCGRHCFQVFDAALHESLPENERRRYAT
jgi:diguanylate cyclase (GGDEF)-like protein